MSVYRLIYQLFKVNYKNKDKNINKYFHSFLPNFPIAISMKMVVLTAMVTTERNQISSSSVITNCACFHILTFDFKNASDE